MGFTSSHIRAPLDNPAKSSISSININIPVSDQQIVVLYDQQLQGATITSDGKTNQMSLVNSNMIYPNFQILEKTNYKLVPINWFYLLIIYVIISALCFGYNAFEYFNNIKSALNRGMPI